MNIRFVLACGRSMLAALVAAAAAPLPAAAADSATVVVTAQQIALYADRGLMLANGGVAVRGPALQFTATRAAYDLRTNRLTAAGDVSVRDSAGVHNGQGYVYDFTAKRGSFDSHAYVPQLSSADATATGQQVDLRPRISITFTNAQVLTGSTVLPVASYAYAIPSPSAKDFGYSPVPSAALEWPVMLTTSRDAYTFARARYDRYNGGPGAGLEEHYAATARGYGVLGETLDPNGARFDLATFERINGALSQTLTASYLLGTHAWRYALSSTGRYGYASLSSSQYNASRTDDLYVTGNQHAIGRIAQFRLQADLGHDLHPGDAKVTDDLRITPGVHLDSASLRVGGASLTSSADLGEAIYNYGRGTLASSATLWATFPENPRLLWTGGATFSHNAPPYPATTRTYIAGVTWRASEAFNLVSSLQYAHDYGQAPGYGRPEFIAAFDVRVKRKKGSGIEVGTLLPFGRVGNMYRQAVLNLRFIK